MCRTSSRLRYVSLQNGVCPEAVAESLSKTNLPIFSTPNPSSRRRFQDFVFLRENLVRDFPACVVPALPDKHRLGAFVA